MYKIDDKMKTAKRTRPIESMVIQRLVFASTALSHGNNASLKTWIFVKFYKLSYLFAQF